MGRELTAPSPNTLPLLSTFHASLRPLWRRIPVENARVRRYIGVPLKSRGVIPSLWLINYARDSWPGGARCAMVSSRRDNGNGAAG